MTVAIVGRDGAQLLTRQRQLRTHSPGAEKGQPVGDAKGRPQGWGFSGKAAPGLRHHSSGGGTAQISGWVG